MSVPPIPDPREDGSVVARDKFSCPACGAEAHWNPARQKLLCPFCGSESPAPLDASRGGAVLEHDLVAALRRLPESSRGWQAAKTSVRCQSCRAVSVFDAEKVAQRCDFCGSSALVPYEQIEDAFRPESLLPFQVSEPQARDLIRAWYGRQWLAPNRFTATAVTDTVKGLYLPYWTFDAKVDASWTAEAGRYYYVKVGKTRVRHVRWSPASGAVSHVFDDELVCASLGVNAAMLRKVEPFPTGALVPYDPQYVAGWTVERYQIDLDAAATSAGERMNATIHAMCVSQIPGDTYRNLSVNARFYDQTFKHVLVPVWLLTYRYSTSVYQVVLNGVTGRIAGTRPWSWVKILLLVLAGVAAALLATALANN